MQESARVVPWDEKPTHPDSDPEPDFTSTFSKGETP